jgi:hypothetical protein
VQLTPEAKIWKKLIFGGGTSFRRQKSIKEDSFV